jgi:hypothetical protein
MKTIRIRDTFRQGLKQKERNCSYLSVSTVFWWGQNCRLHVLRIPRWPNMELPYSNGQVHIHESVVRLIWQAWKTLLHINVTVLWNVRKSSLHCQVEQPAEIIQHVAAYVPDLATGLHMPQVRYHSKFYKS